MTWVDFLRDILAKVWRLRYALERGELVSPFVDIGGEA